MIYVATVEANTPRTVQATRDPGVDMDSMTVYHYGGWECGIRAKSGNAPSSSYCQQQ